MIRTVPAIVTINRLKIIEHIRLMVLGVKVRLLELSESETAVIIW